MAGVAGNGQSELLEALAGIRPVKSGQIRWKGRDLADAGPPSPRGMRRLGLGHVPEDRQRMGLIMPFAARESAILGYHDEATYNGAIRLRRSAVAESFRRQAADYDIRPRNGARQTSAFSGGNQQKIVLARELDRSPDLLLVGQPTRGVDIGAIEFIHRRSGGAQGRGQGAPPGLGRAGRDPRARRPHPRDARRPDRRGAAARRGDGAGDRPVDGGRAQREGPGGMARRPSP